jgi:hypothetical protein
LSSDEIITGNILMAFSCLLLKSRNSGEKLTTKVIAFILGLARPVES